MKEPKTLFDLWLRGMVDQALQDGQVTVADIELLYANVKQAAGDQGWQQGYHDGYAQAVADTSKEGEDK